MQYTLRNIIESDLPDLKKVLDSSELFPAEMLDEMIADYLTNPQSKAIWFTALRNDTPIALGYCDLEKLTDETYNLYAIAVDKELQGQGIGGLLMDYIEKELQKRGGRILIVETADSPAYNLTRQFYLKYNYQQVATIPEFWEEGEGKVVFWKKLNASN